MLIRLALLGLVLVAAMTLGDWISSPVEPCKVAIQQNSETKKSDQSAKEYCSTGHLVAAWRFIGAWIDTWHDDLLAAATIVIALFTVILAIASDRQSRLTRESIDLARNEFNATHRPKIVVHAAELRRDLSKAPGMQAEEYFLGASLLGFNVGESTAKSVEVRGQIFSGSNFAVDVQRPVVKTFEQVVSGTKLRAEIKSDIPLTTAAMGKRTGIDYHCLGWIAYWDQNGLRRETGFCFRLDLWGADGGERWVSAWKPEYDYEY